MGVVSSINDASLAFVIPLIVSGYFDLIAGRFQDSYFLYSEG